MSQALYTAMSGISAASTSLEVISNNIANISTSGYKSKSAEFSDVFYQTISSGSVATDTTGGTNPVQVGVGTKVTSINTDFSTGSWKSTGSSTDCMIDGSGFFCVKGSDGSTYYSRDGNFKFDSDGNLVNSNGYKVCGTDSISSASSSGETVKVPLTICADVKGTGSTAFGQETLNDLNATSTNITSGDFNVSLTGSNGSTYSYEVTSLEGISDSATTISSLTQLLQSGTSGTVSGLNATYTDASGNSVVVSGITATVSNGKITLSTSGGSVAVTTTTGVSTTTAVSAMTFNTTDLSNATNFLKVSGLSSTSASSGTYSSDILDYSVGISQVTSDTASIAAKTETINTDGSIQVTYEDGSVLSVQLGKDGTNYEFLYTTAEDVPITGDKCSVNSNVASVSNFVTEVATITNTSGLISSGSNLYEAGPNTGNITYTIAGHMGSGRLETGGLEASNVDMSDELSNMIVAQRAVQANSRVFSTESDVLQTIVNMGQ